jgi:hypothetical protein
LSKMFQYSKAWVALHDFDTCVEWKVLPDLMDPAGPIHDHGTDRLAGSQPEVNCATIHTAKPCSSIHLLPDSFVTASNHEVCSDGVTVGMCANQSNLQYMIRRSQVRYRRERSLEAW